MHYAAFPTLLYRNESWAPMYEQARINAEGIEYLRSVCGKNRSNRVKNENVREEYYVLTAIYELYKKSTLWFGPGERTNADWLEGYMKAAWKGLEVEVNHGDPGWSRR